ncbi:MAG: (2Fe-2S) ferredoxin domain-containing protein [Marmoricola sp.]
MDNPPRQPVVLVGMSVRELQARDLLLELAREHDASVAFLQLGDPSLSIELDRLADLGAERIVLVGVSLGSLAPAVSWLRRIAAHWWRERPGHRPVVDVGTALVKEAGEVRAVLGMLRPVTGTEPGLVSAAWEEVTEHHHQVLICRGPRCTALGSDRTAEALILELMRLGQGDDDVLITHTGCQFPCNQAPVVSVQPDDVWYGGVDPDVAREIASEHLVEGRTVESHRLPRTRRTPRT